MKERCRGKKKYPAEFEPTTSKLQDRRSKVLPKKTLHTIPSKEVGLGIDNVTPHDQVILGWVYRNSASTL